MYKKWTGTLTLKAPLSHLSDETLSIDSKFRRMRIQRSGKPEEIPVYTGNAFRGRLRRLIMADLIELCGGGQLPDKMYYTLFSGGALEKGAGKSALDVAFRRLARSTIPPLSLLGAAHTNQMISGKLRVGIAWPVATETAEITGHASQSSIWEMTDEIFYTRKDDLEDKKDTEAPPQQMKYTVEVLVAGTVLQHTFGLAGQCDETELACFGRMMRLFEADPILGGKSGTGHGLVDPQYTPDWPDAGPYLQFVADNKDGIRKFLGLQGGDDGVPNDDPGDAPNDDPGAVFD